VADTFGDILPLAVGIAISPVPVIAVILMLFSDRARSNGPAFLVGWLVGVAAVTVVVFLLADAGDVATDSDAATGVSWGKLVLGALLLALGVRHWRTRPARGEQAPAPKWMDAIDVFTPVKAFGTGVLLSAINPKNLILAAGAGATIAQAGLTTGKDSAVIVGFVLVACVTIAAPVAVYLFGGQRAQRVLDGWQAWLAEHNAAVMAVILVVIGSVLVGKGLDVFD
jgi:threonine/homoserine/homoserine lactone efflux protein